MSVTIKFKMGLFSYVPHRVENTTLLKKYKLELYNFCIFDAVRCSYGTVFAFLKLFGVVTMYGTIAGGLAADWLLIS